MMWPPITSLETIVASHVLAASSMVTERPHLYMNYGIMHDADATWLLAISRKMHMRHSVPQCVPSGRAPAKQKVLSEVDSPCAGSVAPVFGFMLFITMCRLHAILPFHCRGFQQLYESYSTYVPKNPYRYLSDPKTELDRQLSIEGT